MKSTLRNKKQETEQSKEEEWEPNWDLLNPYDGSFKPYRDKNGKYRIPKIDIMAGRPIPNVTLCPNDPNEFLRLIRLVRRLERENPGQKRVSIPLSELPKRETEDGLQDFWALQRQRLLGKEE